MPKISVVMPTYNAEEYLEEAISDILNQTFGDFELLIINEFGSDDKTVEIVESFNDSRIRLIQNMKQEGIAESLNIGIRESRGEYIARVDADDRYTLNRFAEQVEFLDMNPDISILGSLYEIFGDEEIIKKWVFTRDRDDEFIKYYPFDNEDIKASLLLCCPICHPTVMMRKKDLIEHDLFYKKGSVSEDCELWARACHNVKFANLPKVLCYYRFSGSNATFQKAAEGRALVNKYFSEMMERYLDIDKENYKLLEFNQNVLTHLNNINKLLEKIWVQNKKLNVYNPESLMKALRKYWKIACHLRCLDLEKTFIESLKDKKVCFYGAGVFAEELLDRYDFSKLNILGFLDINKSKEGNLLKGYEIFYIDSLAELNPDVIILTVLESSFIYYNLVSDLLKKNLNIMVIPSFVEIINCKNIYENSMFYD